MFSYWLFWITRQVFRRLPRRACHWLAEKTADCYFFFSRRDKVAVMDNLEAIFAYQGRQLRRGKKELRQRAREVFRNFAWYLADFLAINRMDRAYMEKYVEIENRHYFDRSLRDGKGIIAVIPVYY